MTNILGYRSLSFDSFIIRVRLSCDFVSRPIPAILSVRRLRYFYRFVGLSNKKVELELGLIKAFICVQDFRDAGRSAAFRAARNTKQSAGMGPVRNARPV